ncbi:hypothetical protein EM20IM_02855 [Candidatus Methylacidiphilum infernorum]|uniref:Uncharacterized protein n=1 Tax=Candidatus Methylacidiphilum infernorum TaxID=511746 RepID=A0ABX7PWB6_9BACT|nr:hypothetical protein [Candidatus Methylacidiphilum infernorum]QSR87289.1 hypothetical protein EM20IM_02855 [Candidatus Methylacidiphilum infernorum]
MRLRLAILLFFIWLLSPFSLLGKASYCDCEGTKIVIIKNGKVLNPTDKEAQEVLDQINQEIVFLDKWQDQLWERISRLQSLFLEEQRELFKIQQSLFKDLKGSLDPFLEEQKPPRPTLPQPKKRSPFSRGEAILVSHGPWD